MNEVFIIRKILFRGRNGIQPRKKIEDKSLIIRIFMYSAMKIRAKVPDLYSVLKPETNSDSPSAKSKGDRLVSARAVQNQVKNDGKHKRKIHEAWLRLIVVMLKDKRRTKEPRRIKAMLTS